MTPKCPDCKMDQDDCICASPSSVPEGWKDFLQDLTQKISEAMYHTPDYFHRDMVRLAHRAHKLLAAAPTPPSTEDRKDAERYRVIKNGEFAVERFVSASYGWTYVSIKELDEVLDAAMQEDRP